MAAGESSPPAPQPVSSEALKDKLKDFDDRGKFKTLLDDAVAERARNFVVQFGAEKAQIAVNLDAPSLQAFLETPDPEYPVRWINIWNPSQQKQAVDRIKTHYKLSERLEQTLTLEYPDRSATDAAKEKHKVSVPEKDLTPSDPEVEAASNSSIELEYRQPAPPSESAREHSRTLQLMTDTLNYSSIDQGTKFICIGANWLHKRPEVGEGTKKASLVLPKHWSWFALCDDATVLSFHEKPRYDIPTPIGDVEQDWKAAELKNMRYNTVKVLSQLSKHGKEPFKDNILAMTSIRESLQVNNEGRRDGDGSSRLETKEDVVKRHGVEGSSSLFYYLFEDYQATLVILENSKVILDKLTKRVLGSGSKRGQESTTDIVRSMYEFNKELRQLQHLFESYNILITRISRLPVTASDINPVSLSQSAHDRFERLGDRIQQLMLNTIQECLDEKTALSDTYFNLTAQKDSRAMARLSRSATLLAKLSVFFLPLSQMTAYFSLSIPEIQGLYSLRTYWYAFAGVASVSFVCLFFFSRMLMRVSETLDTYVDRTTVTVTQRGKSLWGRRRREGTR